MEKEVPLAEASQPEPKEDKDESQFQIELSEGLTTPVRIWFATYQKKSGFLDLQVSESKTFANEEDIVVFDDVWQSLALYICEPAERSLCKE